MDTPTEQQVVAPVINTPTPSPTPPSSSEHKSRSRPNIFKDVPPPDIEKIEFKMDDSLLSPDSGAQRIENDVVINTNASQDAAALKKGLKEEKVETKKEEGKPAEEVKKDEVKVEEKKEEKKKSPLDVLKMPPKTEEIKKEEAIPTKEHVGRDYSIFDAEEQAAAKQMSNGAFEQFTKLKKQSLEGSGQVFYQHPDAYTTHPQYKQSLATVQQGEQEHEFWQQQLLNCKANKPIKNLTGYDSKTGQPVFGADVSPSPLVEEQIRQLMYTTQQNTQQARVQAENIKQQYQREYQSIKTNFNVERNKRFAWAANPEMLKATLDLVDDKGEKHTMSVQEIKDNFKSLFPAYLSSDMGVEVASDLMVALQMQKAFYATEGAKEAIKETIKAEEKAIEPSSDTKPAKKGDAFGGISEFSAAGMPQIN